MEKQAEPYAYMILSLLPAVPLRLTSNQAVLLKPAFSAMGARVWMSRTGLPEISFLAFGRTTQQCGIPASTTRKLQSGCQSSGPGVRPAVREHCPAV